MDRRFRRSPHRSVPRLLPIIGVVVVVYLVIGVALPVLPLHVIRRPTGDLPGPTVPTCAPSLPLLAPAALRAQTADPKRMANLARAVPFGQDGDHLTVDHLTVTT